MEFSDETDVIFKALATFRTKVKQPSKSADNPFFKSKYVQLEGVVKAIDDAIAGTGLSYFQEATADDTAVAVSTIISHESGQYILLAPLAVPVGKKDAQAFGSAETYARRYALSAAFGITSDVDDDGNAASSGYQNQQSRPRQQQSKRPQQRQQAQPKPVQNPQVTALGKLIKDAYTKLPAADKPAKVGDYAEQLIGLANANAGSTATTLSQLTPEAVRWMNNYLVTQSKKLVGGDGE